MKKRVLSILLAISLLLTACGSKDPPEGAQTGSSTPVNAVTEGPTKADDWILIPQQIEQTAASVVRLEVYDKHGTRIGLGTGFAAMDTGILVTANHVVKDMDHARATADDGSEFTVDSVLVVDEADDIAIVKLPKDVSLPVLKAGEVPLRGEPTAVIGSQAGVVNLVSVGNYNGIWEHEDAVRYMFSSPVSGGSSGAPLFNRHGEVIGIVSGTYDKAQNLNIAVPMEKAFALYKQFTEDKEK